MKIKEKIGGSLFDDGFLCKGIFGDYDFGDAFMKTAPRIEDCLLYYSPGSGCVFSSRTEPQQDYAYNELIRFEEKGYDSDFSLKFEFRELEDLEALSEL